MNINTYKLIAAQRILAERIEKEHPRQPGEDRELLRGVANIVELGEMLNEDRNFKFWSNRREATDKLLEEYVDVLHFFLNIAIDFGWENVIHVTVDGIKEVTQSVQSKEKTFMEIVFCLSAVFVLPQQNYYEHEVHIHDARSRSEKNFRSAWLLFIALGNTFGFTGPEIEEAYFAKGQINLERQDAGY